MGARGPVGLVAPAFAAAVRAGIRRIADHPFMVDGRGNPVPAAMDARLPVAMPAVARLGALGRSVLEEALAPLPPFVRRPGMLEVLLALPEPRPGFSEEDVTRVVRDARGWAGEAGKFLSVTVVGRGHAGALEALRVAGERIASHRAEVCAIVAADSYFDADTIDWLETHQQIATEGVRDGFPLGEGAGCLVVAERGTAREWGVAPTADLRGVATAVEREGIKGANEGLGRALTEAVAAATGTLRLPEEAIDATFCDINGERYRSQEWAFTMLRLGRALRTPEYASLVSCCGDVGAASGALLCVLAARAWAREYAAGPRALVWCSSEGGLRGAAVIERPSRRAGPI